MAAGLGFKDFTTGEVLTAADVDGYLMQGVWVFASAAARDAAVTSPQEGNFAYLKDTNVTTYYTGSAWANLDTTGMTNPMTTTGDIIYSSPGSTPVRLGIGTANQVLTVNSGATAPEWKSAGTAINPNIIINGNFTINQRAYTSGTNLASGSFGFDRWKSNYTNTSLTFTSAPQGQSVTISVDGVIRQIVERANVDAGTYVLSWSGTATGRIYNSGGTPPSYAASPISFTADGLADVIVEFTAVSTTKTLSKVKLELGSTATAFVFCGGDIAGELAECQRYFYNHVSGNSKAIATAFYSTNTMSQANIKFPSTMRTTPTLIATSGSNYYGFARTAGDDFFDDLLINMAAESNANVYNGGQSSGTQGDAGFFYTNNAATSISFSAEI